MKTLALITMSILGQLASAADLQPPVGRFLLATHTDGGSIDASIATIEKHDADTPTIAFKFLGVDWNGSIRFRTRTTLITPGGEESRSGKVFDGILTNEEGSRTVA